MELSDKAKQAILTQGATAALGAVAGAATGHAVKPGMRTPVVAQVTSAMGAAARNGAGVGGTVAAGTAVLVAKGAAVAAVATAATPFVVGAAIIGGTLWGGWKLIKYLDS